MKNWGSQNGSTASAGDGYDKKFQENLLAHLIHNPKLAAIGVEKLKVADFELPICQLVWEAVLLYWDKCRELPDFRTLELLVEEGITNRTGEYKTYVSPEEYEALSYLLEFIHEPGQAHDNYMLPAMQDYIRNRRTLQIIDQHRSRLEFGHAPDELFTELNDVSRNTDSISDEETLAGIADVPGLIYGHRDVIRVTTGLDKLDRYLDGGVELKKLGMITGCPGRGKTNVLTHFAAAASLAMVRSMVISLELPADMIRRRYLAMTACIPGDTLKRPVGTWTEEEAERLYLVLDESSYFHNYCYISDLSSRKYTTERIEREIVKWKETIRDRYGQDEADLCQLVCVDWLDQLRPKTTNSRKAGWEDLVSIITELGYIARNHNVVLWTATQGTKQAERKTTLGTDDVAGAYHKNDPIDIGIGIGLGETARAAAMALPELGAEDEELLNRGREMVFTVNKNRQGLQGACRVYQAPTLRFYDSEARYSEHRRNMMNGQFNPAVAHVRNSLAGRPKVDADYLKKHNYVPFLKAAADLGLYRREDIERHVTNI